MKQQKKEIEFNGSFEDSDLDESEEDYDDDGNDDDVKGRKLRKQKKKFYPQNKIIMNVSDTQYSVVKFVGKVCLKWILQYESENFCWDLMWTDNAVQPETLSRMQPHQKINHFPGMYQLARKNYLGRNLTKMQRQFPLDYKFFPRTWLLPAEYSDFKAQFQKGKVRTFIVKPEASCQGRGIFLTRNLDDINPQDHYVAQRYIHKPLLIEGLKFDLRLYVLLAGCDPLRIYLYREGLARFATEEYTIPHSSNIENMCVHLTNYAINKDNPNFVFNQSAEQMDVGHKRSFTSVLELLRQQGHSTEKLMESIKDIIIKTFCSVQPILQQNYRSCQSENFMNNMCFEVLGFDILIDHQLRPLLLEVNHTPSFTTDTPLDAKIKKQLIEDTVRLMNINITTKTDILTERREQMQKRVLTGKKLKYTLEEKAALRIKAMILRDDYENEHMGNYEKVYPLSNEQEQQYDTYIQYALKLYEEWTGANIRRNTKKNIAEGQDFQERKSKLTNELQKIYGPLSKNPLYKNVQSKVNTNLKPTLPSLEREKGETEQDENQMQAIIEDEGLADLQGEDSNPTMVIKTTGIHVRSTNIISQSPVGQLESVSFVEVAPKQQATNQQVNSLTTAYRYPPSRQNYKVRHSQQNSITKLIQQSKEQKEPNKQETQTKSEQVLSHKCLSPVYTDTHVLDYTQIATLVQQTSFEMMTKNPTKNKVFAIKKAKPNIYQHQQLNNININNDVTDENQLLQQSMQGCSRQDGNVFISSYSNPITKNKTSHNNDQNLFYDQKLGFNGKFVKPKIFNLNFIPSHITEKQHREVLLRNKLQNLQLAQYKKI